MATLDHIIVTVNDRDESVRFYTEVMGFGHDGEDGPFSVIRVGPGTVLQLAPWGTQGGDHLAFELEQDAFDATFRRIKEAGVAFGDTYHDAANMRGPGTETGARGDGDTVYLTDPNGHLLEIRRY